jgi:3-oxoacyl-(acyl-carrier-protein) synthase
MDARPVAAAADPVVASGIGVALGAPDPPCDPGPWLRQRKMRKFMGVQDDLAVVAAGRALEMAGLRGSSNAGGAGSASAPLDPERIGLYIAVGYIPFEKSDIDALASNSTDEAGRFDMRAFSTRGYGAVNPLLTFRCLSNMPAFHVSTNFDIQGPYQVGYPGAGEAHAALEEALAALDSGAVDVALVGGVAHQRNFLVEHHFARIAHPPKSPLRDAGAFLVLERASRAAARGVHPRARLVAVESSYTPFDPFEEAPAPRDPADGFGPASMIASLASAGAGPFSHDVETRDGICASVRWEVLA